MDPLATLALLLADLYAQNQRTGEALVAARQELADLRAAAEAKAGESA